MAEKELDEQSSVSLVKQPVYELCDPCTENNEKNAATRYCQQCDENLCDVCTRLHQKVKITKTHTPISIDEKRLLFMKQCEQCGPDEVVEAENYCTSCEEYLCDNCTLVHKRMKATKDHHIVSKDEATSTPELKEKKHVFCTPCEDEGTSKQADMYCPDCKEFLCQECVRVHKSIKATKSHELKAAREVHPEMSIDDYDRCEPCQTKELDEIGCQLCTDCFEILCTNCAELHAQSKLSKDHALIVYDKKIPKKGLCNNCDPCRVQKKEAEAKLFCEECDEHLCLPCGDQHKVQKLTQNHKVVDEPTNEHFHNCDPCTLKGTNKKALAFCGDCSDELLCLACVKHHKAQRITQNHNLSYNLTDWKVSSKEMSKDSSFKEHTKKKQIVPGKPYVLQIGANEIKVTWKAPDDLSPDDVYQVGFKETILNRKWKIYNQEFVHEEAELKDLKADTAYIFRVRLVSQHGEGPYSEESDEIQTQQSPAFKLVSFSLLTREGKPSIYAIPLTEVKGARNTTAKTRKLEIGSPDSLLSTREKTILLIGVTGTGKSTLVDGFVNYILGVNWNDPFRYTVIHLEEEERGRLKNQALSQTEWISCYIIKPEPGGRLPYQVNIIDTPGFGDTRGLQRDQAIVEQIRQLFSETSINGVAYIDAVCFLAKAPDARLTATQLYIFQSVMSLFGKDIENNICSLITFADGVSPPVQAALKESNLPFGEMFTFNNSGLFAENDNSNSLAPMFWDMGVNSFRRFFEYLGTVQTKSLSLTKHVLDERWRLEMTVKNLQPKVDIGLTTVNRLKQEIQIFEENKAAIESNRNFEYEVTETKQVRKELPREEHVTYCTHCHFTCHERCAYANDDEKRKCSAMNGDGYCKICPDKCFWNKHANTPYIFSYIEVNIKKTYAEMLQKYKDASGKLPNQEQVLQNLGNELDELVVVVEDMMAVVKDCNIRLADIALRPNPLSMTEHIDLMIQAEKLEKKPGFMKRIRTLGEFRRRAELGKHAENFRREAQSTLRAAGADKKNKDTVSMIGRFRKLFPF